MKTLVIVESPAKAKTINKYLGSDYVVRASFGHVRDLPEKDMGIDVANRFAPTYEVSERSKKTVKELQELAKTSDRVLLASDPDREGEAIAWHLEGLLKKHCKNIARVEFHEITKDAVQKAVSTPHEVDLDMVNSQQARRILDRLVGYQISPWLSRSLGEQRLSAGRVQSVALRIVVDRERLIENFKPEHFWKIFALVTPQDAETPFKMELVQYKGISLQGNGPESRISSAQAAQELLDTLKGEFRISSVEKQAKPQRPKPPFTTSTLQQDSNRKLKWDSERTMKIAQQLYEGVELGDGSHGLITYMRTDSTRINEAFQQQALDYISETFGSEYKPKTPQVYKSKGEAQDAHEAIRPTSIEYAPSAINQHLTPDQKALYQLIWERFVASQMANAIYDTMTVMGSVAEGVFKASGKSVQFDGFMRLYTEGKEVEDEQKDKEEQLLLPQVSEGELMNVLQYDSEERVTKPPAKYTEATLIEELERQGVGRPSTYASTIATLKKRDYIRVVKNRFESSPVGRNVVDILVKYFENVMAIKFTASMEEQLDEVARGNAVWQQVLEDFHGPFMELLEIATKEVKPVIKDAELTGKDCPKCGSPLAVKQSKKGKFVGCTSYPNCDHIEYYRDPATISEHKCEKCGGEMIIRTAGKEKFLACSNYPNCRNTKSLDKNGNIPKVKKAGKACPKCGKDLIVKNGKNGKFVSCSGYPDCKHMEPYVDPKAKKQTCDKCGKDMILRKGQYGHFYGCSGYPVCKNNLKADEKGNVIKK